MPRKKTAAQSGRKPAMTVRRADEIIRAAQLEGFGGRCGRVAIAINRVVFGDKGRYVVATNPTTSSHRGRPFIGHVVVEWKGRLFDATGIIDDEHEVESWGMIDHMDPDYDYLTEEQALDGQLHYIDDTYPNRRTQERVIETGTRGQCPLRDVERSLHEAVELTASR